MLLVKRCVIAFLIFGSSLTLAETKQETIDFTLNSRPVLTSDRIHAPGISGELAVTGAPAVPMIVRNFSYPIGSRLMDVRIDGIETKQMRLDRPLPNLPPKPIVSGAVYTQLPPLLVKPGVLYPDNWYTIESRGGLDAETLMPILSVTVRIFPVRVTEDSAEYLEKFTLKLDVDRVDAKESRDAAAMLIIAPQAYLDVMGPFIAHKNAMGLTTMTRSVEDIEENGTAGFDLQDRIKKAIHEAYTASSIRYLLLAGDASNIPVRYTFHMDFGGQNGWTHTPSDLYYADFLDASGEFNSWDIDMDGRFGEFEGSNSDQCDLLPDVLFGRIPAQSVTELQGVLNKLIAYESLSGTEEWLDRIVLLGADTFTAEEHNEHSGVPEGEAICERLNSDHLSAFSTTRLYQTQTYPRDGELTAPAITAAINSGIGILNYANHGNINIWGWGGRTYSTTNVEALENQEKLPVVFSFACLTAAFDTENPESLGYGIVDRSLGEAFILKANGGAVAFFGATRSAFGGGFGYGDHLGAMGYLDWQYFKKIGEGQTAQGRLYLETLTELLTHIGVTGTEEFITAIEYIYFGDPSLTIPGTPVGPNFDLRFRAIDDSLTGNDNHCAEPGETVELVYELSNDGTAASAVSAVLSISDPDITIVNGSVDIADAPRGYRSNLDPGFQVSIASNAARHAVSGTISVTTGSQRSTFPVHFNIGVSAFLTAQEIFVRADPNNDNYANPGESVQFSPDFHNIGCIDASLFTADIQIDDAYVLDYGVCSDGALPVIEPGHSATPGGLFWAELDPITPHQHRIDCLIDIDGPHGYHDTLNLPLFVNDCTMPVLSQFQVIPAAPNPGETIAVTVQAVDGNGVESVSANFLSYGSQGITDVTMYDDGLHGDGQAHDGVYGCSLTLPNTLVYYRVDMEARDGAGYSGTRTGIGGISTIAFESDDPILIVSGAEDDLYLGFYTQALSDAGYRYDIWSYLRGFPTQDVLNRYIDGAVIWYIAHEYPMLQEPERVVIEAYINAEATC